MEDSWEKLIIKFALNNLRDESERVKVVENNGVRDEVRKPGHSVRIVVQVSRKTRRKTPSKGEHI